ncbi:hypothetical protein SBADM41S_09801 [Streptomyces badius]
MKAWCGPAVTWTPKRVSRTWARWFWYVVWVRSRTSALTDSVTRVARCGIDRSTIRWPSGCCPPPRVSSGPLTGPESLPKRPSSRPGRTYEISVRWAELPGRAPEMESATSSGGSVRWRAVVSVIRGSAPSGNVSVSGARFGPLKGTVRSSGSRQLSPSRMAKEAACTWLRCQGGVAAGAVPGPGVVVAGVSGASVTRSTRTR